MVELIHGDSIKVIPTLPNKYNLVFIDPPYNIGIDYGDGPKADLLSKEGYTDFIYSLSQACIDKMTDNGSFWCLISDEYVSRWDIALQDLGLFRRNWIVIYESFGVQTKKKFARTKRHLLYFVKNEKKFTFNYEEVLVPSARLMRYKDNRANPKGKVDEDIWQMTRLCGTFKEREEGFPTQLPLDLLRRIIKVASNQGDYILDPCSGSGTTILAAKELGRIGTGIEKSEEYYLKSKERIEKHDLSTFI